jgi:hypothetical protein
VKSLGDLAVWPILDHAQEEQFALGVAKVPKRKQHSRWKRQAIVNSLKVGVHHRDREAQALPRSLLHPSLAQGRPEHIVGNPVEPRQCGSFVLVSKPPSAPPGQGKDLGCQIGAIVTDAGSRPGEDLADVPVVELGEGVRIVEDQQLGVGQL